MKIEKVYVRACSNIKWSAASLFCEGKLEPKLALVNERGGTSDCLIVLLIWAQ